MPSQAVSRRRRCRTPTAHAASRVLSRIHHQTQTARLRKDSPEDRAGRVRPIRCPLPQRTVQLIRSRAPIAAADRLPLQSLRPRLPRRPRRLPRWRHGRPTLGWKVIEAAVAHSRRAKVARKSQLVAHSCSSLKQSASPQSVARPSLQSRLLPRIGSRLRGVLDLRYCRLLSPTRGYPLR